MREYDVAVLGGGPGGYVAALRAALRDAKTCCIEATLIGGTCLNTGCIPTKAMLRASEVFWHTRHAKEFGFSTAEPRVDGPAFMGRVTATVAQLRNGVEYLLKARKVDVVAGRGRLTAPNALAVENADGAESIRAKAVIIATGTRPARPGFLPWDCGRLLTTDEATTGAQMPESILIIGGGVIGCEFATIYSELGIPTVVVEMLDRLLPGFDEEASRVVSKSLLRRGVKIHAGSPIVEVTATENGLVAKLENGQTVEAAFALAATGRVPNIENIGLDELGIERNGNIIRVDERCCTNVEGIYAIGDVAETRQYAHLASRMGIVAADNATGHPAAERRQVLPTGVYTHPEVATVGLSESEAREQHGDIRVARFPYQASGMAHAHGETSGGVKIIADAASGSILGAVVIGRHATDVIAELTLAMRNGLTVHNIAETIHAHPTFAEGVLEAAEAWLGLPLHTLG